MSVPEICHDCARRSTCEHEPDQAGQCAAKVKALTSGFRFVRAGALELRPTEWLAKGLIEKNTLGVLYGKFGSMKSFAALDLAFSVATGRPFLGHATKPGAVLYIAGEGFGGLARRKAAWEKSRGLNLADFPVSFSTTAANLCDAELIAQVNTATQAAAAELGPPVLIIVDTWSRNLGGDENSSLDSSQAVQALDNLRRPYGASVIVVHHSGWGDPTRTRGSTVLMAAADFAFLCEKGVDDIAALKCDKIKDGKAPEPLAFGLQTIPLGILDEDGQEETSAVIQPAAYHEPEKSRGGAPKGKQETLLEKLAEYPEGATLSQLCHALEPILFADPTKEKEQGSFKESRRIMLLRLRQAGNVVQVGNNYITPANHSADMLGAFDGEEPG